MALSKKDTEEIVLIIKTTVNGKIDKMDQKLEEHCSEHMAFIEKLDPVIDGLQWLNTTRRFVLWAGGIVASIAGILTIFK